MSSLKMPSLSWRQTTGSWLPRYSTDRQPPSGSQSAPDLAILDAHSHRNGPDVLVMSPIATSLPLPDVSTAAAAPPDTEDSPYDVTKGSVWDIWACMPKYVRRWEKPASTPMAHVTIPAGSLGITHPVESLPEGWTMYTHPEGKPYYHRDAREPEPELLLGTNLYGEGRVLCKVLAIVTDSDPRDLLTRKLIEHAHFIARVTIAENNVDLPDSVELFLELYPAEEPGPGKHPYAGYYLVDHENHMIFWGTPSHTSDLHALKVNPETFQHHHLKLQMTQQYWYHLQCYPLDGSIEVEIAQGELLRQLSIMQLDIATSPSVSTSDLSEEQCERFQLMVRNCPASCKTWMIARLMTLTTHWQFMNLYGHPSARLDRHHSYEADDATLISDREVITSEPDTIAASTPIDVESQMPEPRIMVASQALVAILLRLCCFLLFDAPAKHNEELQRIWVDKIVNQLRFQELIDRTVADWERVSLLSTVLWTANMGFLAILNPLTVPTPLTPFECIIRRALNVTSLTSTVFSVGSITLGLLYIRKHRVKWTADEAREYLEVEHHPLYGHRLLAILWALPFAFLMLSIVAFSAAILIFYVALEDIITEILLLTLSLCMITWIGVAVWYFWKRETRWRPTLEGVYYPLFRMQFTNWLWNLPATPPTRRKTV